MKISVRTITDLNYIMVRRMHELPQFDMIVGIPRSGLMASLMLGLHMQRTVLSLDQYCNDNVTSELKTILLLDDSLLRGTEMGMAVERCVRARPDVKIIRSAVYVAPGKNDMLDFAFETLQTPRVFPWNIWRSVHLSSIMVDMDGVICRDPTKEENADRSKYEAFLRHAEPLFLPTRQVQAIVTCRLEMYRAETESWLKRHNVRTKELIMLDMPSAEARQKWNQHGEWKAMHYRRLGGDLFVESCAKQSAIISKHGPVFCARTQQRFPA